MTTLLRRLLPRPALSVLLVLLWLFLVNDTGLGSWLMAGALALTLPLWLGPAPPTRLKDPLRLLAYLALVLRDIAVANVQVAAIILFRPADQIRSAWVTVPVDLTSPAAISLLAGTITLTPGTLTADMAADGRSLLIHALHAPDPQALCHEIKTRYEERLKRIFA